MREGSCWWDRGRARAPKLSRGQQSPQGRKRRWERGAWTLAQGWVMPLPRAGCPSQSKISPNGPFLLLHLPGSDHRAETPRGFLQTHFQMRGSISAEWRSQFPALISSLPPPTPRRRQSRGQEGTNGCGSCYLRPTKPTCPFPATPPAPSPGARSRRSPRPSPSIACRDRVTRWTVGSHRSLLCGSLVPPGAG